jgi:hypothetical protein
MTFAPRTIAALHPVIQEAIHAEWGTRLNHTKGARDVSI